MSHDTIPDSALESMCQEICLGFGQNQYEELGLEVNNYCDLITSYNENSFRIVQENPCDGGYYLKVFYKGKKVLESSMGDEDPEGLLDGQGYIALRRKEDYMEMGMTEEEIEEKGRNGSLKPITLNVCLHKIEIIRDGKEWINEIIRLHKKNLEKIREKLELSI